MRVHVTGGSGFLGGHVIPLLLEAGHIVSALARSDMAARRIEALRGEPVMGDLDMPETFALALRLANAEALVNLASLGSGHAERIVRATQEAGVSRAIFVSTTAILTTLNAPSKRIRTEAERLVKTSGLEWTIVRPTMIYGAPGDRNMERLLRFLKRSRIVPLPGRGQRLQQPVHVSDLAHAISSSLERQLSFHRIYDLAGPQPLTFRRVIEHASKAVGKKPILVPLPLRPLITSARLYERAASHPRLTTEQIQRLAEDKTFDIETARRDLGYAPRSFQQGIRQEAALLRL